MTSFLLLAAVDPAAADTTMSTAGVILVWVPILLSCVIICMLLVSLRKAVRRLQNLELQTFEQLRAHTVTYGQMLEVMHQQTNLLREVSAKLGEDFPAPEVIAPNTKSTILPL